MGSELELLERETIPVFNFSIRPKGNVVRIVPVGDVHYGHKACMVEKVKDFLKYIEKTPDTYTILMGDLIENVLPDTVGKHRGAMWEQCMTPAEQIAGLKKLLKPLVDKNKILFGIGGTHSVRSWYASGFDPEEGLAEELGYGFAALDGLANIRIGEHIYTIHAVHGTGSTGDPAAVLRKLLTQPRRIADADVYLRGHHHSKLVATDYRFDATSGRARKAIYAGTGSFLGYVGTYAERNAYFPAVPGAIKIKLYKGKRDIHVTI
jgi:hypothetical protein